MRKLTCGNKLQGYEYAARGYRASRVSDQAVCEPQLIQSPHIHQGSNGLYSIHTDFMSLMDYVYPSLHTGSHHFQQTLLRPSAAAPSPHLKSNTRPVSASVFPSSLHSATRTGNSLPISLSTSSTYQQSPPSRRPWLVRCWVLQQHGTSSLRGAIWHRSAEAGPAWDGTTHVK